MAEWTEADIYQWGTQASPELRHSMLYFARDISKTWAERACERDDYVTARALLARHERCHARLVAWRCEGCRICPPAAQMKERTKAPAAAPTTMGEPI